MPRQVGNGERMVEVLPDPSLGSSRFGGRTDSAKPGSGVERRVLTVFPIQRSRLQRDFTACQLRDDPESEIDVGEVRTAAQDPAGTGHWAPRVNQRTLAGSPQPVVQRRSCCASPSSKQARLREQQDGRGASGDEGSACVLAPKPCQRRTQSALEGLGGECRLAFEPWHDDGVDLGHPLQVSINLHQAPARGHWPSPIDAHTMYHQRDVSSSRQNTRRERENFPHQGGCGVAYAVEQKHDDGRGFRF